ncbi:molybdate transport system regulatory protein [Halogranum gelatinilyticum]|uniref:Molybdate transport system regulatory protein n=1 Tax=Halogranum gelatinilyticum TaxID=660521 RepID=A0A1G9XRK6_9EURY|nr:TOBE domain-containing protein [Halogranum gelatinilyticum]SDM99469.1 molybdate transport system regulatory protein [Halogranum gelatinilyticum]
MDAGVEARLHAGDVTFGTDDATLLGAIRDHGSVSAAASELGRSRPRALSRLEALESAFGPLVERRRGGSGGGGSQLTDGACELLARFDRLRAALSGTAQVAETVFEGTVTERTGELALVETPAGTLRALVAGADTDADAGVTVQVSVRADAVTLHAPDDAPDEGATSARNRFSGTVASLDRGEAVARVGLDVGTETPLTALVTVESVERLALAVGDRVVASFKATATRATVI